jgi:arginase family enzyme
MFIVKVPGINGLGKTLGCEKSGNEILKCLKEEFNSNEYGKETNFSSSDLEEIHLDNSNLELTNKLIFKNALEIFELKEKVIFLGGDHSITFSLGKAFFENCKLKGKVPCLIVFDSNSDCKKISKKSEKFPTCKEWLRYLVEQGFPAENILLVGVRNLDINEIEFLKEKKIRIIGMNQILENIEDACEIIMEFAYKKELYLSLDIGVVDPIFAAATSKIEVGGLTSREFIYIIQRLNKMTNLKAIDLVEINPGKDRNNLTVKLGAAVIAEML